jgi:spore coat protein U-like protein
MSKVQASTLEFKTLDDISWRGTKGYNPFDTRAKHHRVTITIQNNSDDKVDFAIAISKGNENNTDYERKARYGTETLNYQAYTKKNTNRKFIAKEVADIDSSKNLILGSANRYKAKTVYAYFYVDKEQVVNSGIYNDVLTFKLYLKNSGDEDDQSSYELIESRTVQFNVDVHKYILADFSDNSGNLLQINFDELEEGKSETFDIRVQSNSGYQLLANSLNNQYLVLENSRLNKAPYTFEFDKNAIDLTGNTDTLLIQKKKKTSSRGTAFETKITLNQLPPLTAGTYEDKITIILREL